MYDITTFSISQYPTSETVLTIADFFTFPVTTNYNTMSNSFVVDTSAYYLSSQVTMNQDSSTNQCTVCPVYLDYSSTNILVKPTITSTIIESKASQCQNIDYTVQLLTVAGSSSFPSWVSYDSSSNRITLNPSLITSASELKGYSFLMSATDKSLVPGTTTKTFNVNMYNSSPQISSAIRNQIVTTFYTISIQRTINDSDDDTVSYDFSYTGGAMPSGITALYSSDTKIFSLIWTPTNSDVGTYPFALKYWDYFRTSSKLEIDFKITVSQNSPPYFISSLQDQNTREWIATYYSLPSYSDNPGETVTLSWVNWNAIDPTGTWLLFGASQGRFIIFPSYINSNAGTINVSPQLKLED